MLGCHCDSSCWCQAATWLAHADMMFLRLAFPLIVFGAILAFIAVSYKSEWLLTISVCVLAQKYIEGFFDLSYAYMQKSNNWKSLAISTVVRCALLVVIFGAVYVWTNRLAAALLAVTGFSILFYLIFDQRSNPPIKTAELFDFSRLTSARRRGLTILLLPLAVSNVVMSLTTNAPRFLIDLVLGPAELGFFAAVSHFVVVGAVATGSVGHAILPVLAEAIRNRREREFWLQLIGIMVVIQVACGVGIVSSVFFGGEILRLLYGDAFAGPGYADDGRGGGGRTGLLCIDCRQRLLRSGTATGIAGLASDRTADRDAYDVIGASILGQFWRVRRNAGGRDNTNGMSACSSFSVFGGGTESRTSVRCLRAAASRPSPATL